MTQQVFIVAPEYQEVWSKRRNFDLRSLRSGIVHHTSDIEVQACTTHDFVSRTIGNPTEILKAISLAKERGATLFYFLGELYIHKGELWLRLRNSKQRRSRSLLRLTDVVRAISTGGHENQIVLEDVSFDSATSYPSPVADRATGVSNVTLIDSAIERRTEMYTSFADAVLKLLDVMPSVSLTRALSFYLAAENDHVDGLKSLAPFVLSGKVKSGIWKADEYNFQAESLGSREDSLQTLRYARSDPRTRSDANRLLNFFRFTDPSHRIRQSAEQILAHDKSPLIAHPSTGKAHIADDYFDRWPVIEEGFFEMGSSLDTDPYSLPEERPQHRLFLHTFKMSPKPVSIGDWSIFLKDTLQYEVVAEREILDQKCPKTWISWYEAMNYCRWLTEIARSRGIISRSQEVRLPTEAEWEKAARGCGGQVFPWGNQPPEGRCNYLDEGHGQPVPSGSYSPIGDSPYGLKDMAGNAWEWTLSNWGEVGATPTYSYPYQPNDGREDVNAPDYVRRVVRGGSWYYFGHCLRCATRNLMFPGTKHHGGGFRPMLTNNLIVEGAIYD